MRTSIRPRARSGGGAPRGDLSVPSPRTSPIPGTAVSRHRHPAAGARMARRARCTSPSPQTAPTRTPHGPSSASARSTRTTGFATPSRRCPTAARTDAGVTRFALLADPTRLTLLLCIHAAGEILPVRPTAGAALGLGASRIPPPRRRCACCANGHPSPRISAAARSRAAPPPRRRERARAAPQRAGQPGEVCSSSAWSAHQPRQRSCVALRDGLPGAVMHRPLR